ncbi:N-acyl-D-amino-acid deacylase family protein [Anatilimnocola floriformis]|uniref:N-acyl-D-amino-acid deacylase family protein n=1 Tax=Anatilimnocola floriformis TaxID=2948575 RepID=UPI0020C4158A|nr:D-aminoacylase [Anatilimnocola floriformis]
MFDTIIHGGEIIDGTGAPRIRGDVGLLDGRIAAVGELSSVAAAARIDATGRIVAPGFVDVHNHSDGWLLSQTNFWPKTSQGFTTEVLMADGISYAPVDRHTWRQWIFYLRALNGLRLQEYRDWESIGEYCALLDGHTAQNVATHVPYANCRTLHAGFGHRPLDDYQRRNIRREIEMGMEQGGVGLSTGLDYLTQCAATTDELVDACRAIARFDGLYVTHIRYKAGLFVALDEAVEIGKRAGVKVHISHLKGTTPQEVDQVLEFLERARREVDLSFDVYPYQRSSTMLNYLLPYEAWREGPLQVVANMGRDELLARFRVGLANLGVSLDKFHIAWTSSGNNSIHHGKLLSDYIAEMNRPAEEALYHLLIEENLAMLLVINAGDDSLVQPLLAHDLYMMGSDGIWFPDSSSVHAVKNSVVHPRVYGSTGRLLGSCVREQRLFSLESAVQKLSGVPAARFGLRDRGVIREGAWADLVVFDAVTVADHATYEQPQQICAGIEHVLVNGQVIVKNAAPIEFNGSAPGKFLRYQP